MPPAPLHIRPKSRQSLFAGPDGTAEPLPRSPDRTGAEIALQQSPRVAPVRELACRFRTGDREVADLLDVTEEAVKADLHQAIDARRQ